MTVQIKWLFVLSIAATTFAADLILSGVSRTIGGYQVYGVVRLTSGAKIIVPDYDGRDAVNTGHLQINATSIFIDSTSSVTARGAGYQTKLCMNGTAPAAFPGIGAAGGCAVYDSGGGGGHVGPGGIGTKDCALKNTPPKCLEPQEYEEACSNTMVAGAGSCPDTNDCRNNDALPRTAGDRYLHSVFDRELGMGPSGGDKGCRDGDGFGVVATGGAGGGRIRLIADTMEIYGTVDASGKRGCGIQNDSGGGGAGGTVVLMATNLIIGLAARIRAAGGLGGDSQPKDTTVFPECINSQLSGQCDDCGGGGGGGIIYVKGQTGNFSRVAAGKTVDNTIFDIKGAEGGSCVGCKVESRGIDGRVQVGSYGELCNGFDDTWDGIIDEDQAPMDCYGTLYPSCISGVPQDCPDPPTMDEPTTDDTSSSSTPTPSSDSQPSATQTPTQNSESQSASTPGSSNSQSNSQGSQANSQSSRGSQGSQGTNAGSRSNSQGSQTVASGSAGSQTDKSNVISVSGSQNPGSGSNSGQGNSGSTGDAPISESSGTMVMVSVLSLIAVLVL